jgi:cell division protein ZapA (FtsZ GTPase activity inhibitor)
VVIDVAGQRLRLSGQSDSEHVTALAALVNERYETLQRAGRGASPTQVLAMLALNLADEVLSERARSQAGSTRDRPAQEVCRIWPANY